MNARTTCGILAVVLMALAPAAMAAPATNAAVRGVGPAILEARRDVATAVAELNAARDRHAALRMPLAQRLEGLDRAVREQRRDADRLREARAQGERERRELDESVHGQETEVHYVQTALLEYRRSLATRVGPAESDALRVALAEIDRALGATADGTNLITATAALFTLANRWNEERLGGEIFDGVCLDAGGVEHAGRFVALGPMAYFAAGNGGPGGIVGRQVGSLRPSLVGAPDRETAAAILRVCEGGEADLPVDTSGGNALRVAAARETLWAHLRSGGPVMIPIAIVGVLSLVLVLWKLLELRRLRLPEAGELDAFYTRLDQNDLSGAAGLATELGAPLGPILQDGLAHLDAPPDVLEELLHERVMAVLPRLDRHLGMLAVLGGVAPLLGLLGTVTGMIHTFQLVTLFGTGDARLLSGGIAEALVTTEVGLVIAVPVLLVHSYLARKVRTMLGALEQAIIIFSNRVRKRADARRS
jgi:biopolymer transport protein ExbB